MNDTRKEYISITSEIKDLQDCLKDIQDSCPHVTSVYSAHGSMRNWDLDDPAYWYDHYCYDCGKRWTSPQGREHKSTLKVEQIDYKASAERIELLIKLESTK